jgi:fimbrial chaperone protein
LKYGLTRPWAIAALSVAATLFAGLPVKAASFTVSPTTLHFATMTSGDLLITNTNDEPVRLSVSAFDWQQVGRDPEVLHGTQGVVCFPQVFTILGNTTERIRIGVLDPPAPAERSYRVIVSELPPLENRHAHDAQLLILTKVDVPIFLAGAGEQQPLPRIAAISRGRDGVDVTLVNAGTAHVKPSTLTLVGRDPGGSVQWSASARAFYVLAGGRIEVHVPVGISAMRKTHAVEITWPADIAHPLRRTFIFG